MKHVFLTSIEHISYSEVGCGKSTCSSLALPAHELGLVVPLQPSALRVCLSSHSDLGL